MVQRQQSVQDVHRRFRRMLMRQGRAATRQREWNRCVALLASRGERRPQALLVQVLTRLLLPTVNRSASAGGGRRVQQPLALTPEAQMGQAMRLLASTVRSASQGPLGQRLADELTATMAGDSASLNARAQKASQAVGALASLRSSGSQSSQRSER